MATSAARRRGRVEAVDAQRIGRLEEHDERGTVGTEGGVPG